MSEAKDNSEQLIQHSAVAQPSLFHPHPVAHAALSSTFTPTSIATPPWIAAIACLQILPPSHTFDHAIRCNTRSDVHFSLSLAGQCSPTSSIASILDRK